jgi:hypothetical protein
VPLVGATGIEEEEEEEEDILMTTGVRASKSASARFV